MGFQISLCQFHKNSLSERLLEGKDVTLWTKSTHHKAASQMLLCCFSCGIFSFSLYTSVGSEISLHRFYTKSVSNVLHQKKDLSLWGEFTHHKAVSQKASFRFLSEDISFFTIGLNALPKLPLQIPRKECQQTSQWKNDIVLSGEFTCHKEITPKAFLQFSLEDISCFTMGFNAIWTLHSQIPQKKC